MLRGLITEQLGFSGSRQKDILAEHGVKVTYDDVNDLLKSMRKQNHDLVAVADFRGLGTSKQKIVTTLDRIHDAGFAVIDVSHEWRSDGRNGAKALAAADTARINASRGPDGDEAVRFGRKGGLANGKRHKKSRMPKSMAIHYWLDRKLTTAEALEKMNSDPNYPAAWTMGTAYRHLKERGALPGRRANKS